MRVNSQPYPGGHVRTRYARRVFVTAAATSVALVVSALPSFAYGIVLYPTGCVQVPTSQSGSGWHYVCWQGIKYDSHADTVQAVQIALNGEAGYGIATDSLFGQTTASTVCSFQNIFMSQTGGCDGIVGPKTWDTLRSTLAFVGLEPEAVTKNGVIVQQWTWYFYSQNYYFEDFLWQQGIVNVNTNWQYICIDGKQWLMTANGFPPTTLSCR